MNHKISLIYNTCDRYESLWKGFFYLLEKYWPSFDAQIIFNSETKNFSYKNFNIVRPKFKRYNLTWSERLYESLNMVTTPYVLFCLDDFYVKSPVNTKVLDLCIEQMDKDSTIKLFTFGWQPGKNTTCSFSNLFEQRPRFASYRINAQIGLWRVSYLKRIIKLYENPWEFELNGSFRSSLYGGKIFSLKKNSPLVFDYDWGFLVVRGQLNKEVSDFFEIKEGIKFDSTFKYINMDEYRTRSRKNIGSSLRKFKYLWKMIVSLFRN